MHLTETALPLSLPDAEGTTAEAAGLMDETAFRVFYEQTAPGLHAYLARAHNPTAADDLLQDIFIRYLRAAPTDLEPAQSKAYLYRIASRLIIDHARRLDRERRRNWKDLISGRTAQPSIELSSDVARLFGRLKPRRRALLWLAYVEGFDHGEIAEALGISEGSVRVLLFRARRGMAALLKEAGFAERPTRESDSGSGSGGNGE